MSLSALDALRIGRRTQLQAAAFAGVVWGIPASLAMVVVAQLFDLSVWWVLLVAALVLGLVLVRRRTAESVCLHAIDTGLKLQGAFELAVELERGREIGARFQAAIETRVRGALTPAGVRRSTWEFAPRFLIASLMISSILVVALGVVRNLQPKALPSESAAQVRSPLDRVALLQALRSAREAGLLIELDPNAEPTNEALANAVEVESSSPETSSTASRDAAERADNGTAQNPSAPAAAAGDSATDPVDAATSVSNDSNPLAAPGQAPETGASTANLATEGPSGVTPEPNAGKLSPPVVPAWWPKRHRAVVEAVLRASP